VRRNRPYRGAADGLTTHLRRKLGPRYLGIELEVSQRFFAADGSPRGDAATRIAAAVGECAAAVVEPVAAAKKASPQRKR
jgi:hypothetical protein